MAKYRVTVLFEMTDLDKRADQEGEDYVLGTVRSILTALDIPTAEVMVEDLANDAVAG